MIWTGGALLKDSVITKTGSQTDIPATLLSQFGLSHDEYTYSKDLLNPNGPAFAFYAFNNGFGFKTDTSFVIWDNDYNRNIEKSGNHAGLCYCRRESFFTGFIGRFLVKIMSHHV